VGGWNLVGLPAWATAGSDFEAIFRPQEGDRLVRWTSDNSGYDTYEYGFGEWTPIEPLIPPGEGFWYYRNEPRAVAPGGSILFDNIDTRFHAVAGCPLEGDYWLAQLQAGPVDGSMSPVGDPVPFLTGDGAGYFDTGPDAVRHVPTVTPGSGARARIVVWTAQHAATYEEAVANGAMHGQTREFELVTGGGGDPPSLPSPMYGFEEPGGFPLIDEISGEQVAFPGAPARFSVSHHYIGPRTVTYQWQRAIGEMEWGEVTGATGSTLELALVQGADAGSYRVRVDVGCAVETSAAVELKVLAAAPFSNPAVDPGTGQFRFTFEADPSHSYAIELSTDLETWSLLSTVSNPAGPVEIADPETSEHLHRFYRARILRDEIVLFR
jgi:hypothetical protein